MKVTFWYKDGSHLEIQVPEGMPSASQAIKYAKEQLSDENKEGIERVEVEEDFI